MTQDRRQRLQEEFTRVLRRSDFGERDIRREIAQNPKMNAPEHPAKVQISETPRTRQGILEVWDSYRYEAVSAEVQKGKPRS